MDLWRQRVASVLKYDYEKTAPLDPIKVLFFSASCPTMAPSLCWLWCCFLTFRDG